MRTNNAERSNSREEENISGLDEIESAFDRVSSVADALLDSIRDDSLRGKQKKNSRKIVSKIPGVRGDGYNDDDDDEDDGTFGGNSFGAPDFDDDSILTYEDGAGEDISLDGSLAQDMKRLKSATKALRKDLSKEDKEFHQSGGDANSYFKKKEAEAQKATTSVVNLSFETKHNQESAKTQLGALQSTAVAYQYQQFCSEKFGSQLNLLLLLLSFTVWVVFCKFIYNAKNFLPDEKGHFSTLAFSLFKF